MSTFENFQIAMELMLFGMGGIFLVLFLLYIVCIVLLKRFPADK